MKTRIVVLSEAELREIIRDEMKQAIRDSLPELLRKANRKEFLTTADFKELTGCSSVTQLELRKSGRISYSQEGRKVFYRTEDVERFMEERRVKRTK